MTAIRRPRRLARIFTGAALSVGALLGAAAAPAAAADPNPEAAVTYQEVGDSVGVRVGLTQDGSFLGQVEFDPAAQQLRVLDTKNDDDTFYVHVSSTQGGAEHNLGTYSASGSEAPVDSVVKNFDLPKGTPLDIEVYDDAALTDYIGGARGTGSAIA
ncbi:hypothetical protein OG785_11650 [Streptomyces sp. NBC_00006]|uniref:hypothetical protein n=1 Tax=unclassified Streptomyces TaxID=2593676 RepID=UPI0022579664|nr:MULTISPECIES: hypothetical protein [unclassified Streptomyces]MCX5531213.1 hypothetical protein [Streptomyces sp. NBC_00006]